MHSRVWFIACAALLAAAPGCPRRPSGPEGLQLLAPPTGEGCERMQRCCEAMRAIEEELALACRLTTARGGSCLEMIDTTTGIFQGLTEQRPPGVCDASSPSRDDR